MMRRVMRCVVVVCGVLAITAGPAAAQKEAELKAEVPALTAMHEVVMPMWHDAWPKKDVAALAGLARDLGKHVDAIEKAALPGILRDKATPWREGVAKLKVSVRAYKGAAEIGDDAALLKAAEAVHSDYEALVKIVRPVLKEMDDFHTSLYTLYHYQLNPLNVPAAAETFKALQVKMAALNAAVLPDRLKAKQDAFVAQRDRLSKAVDRLGASIGSGDEPRIREAIELMHMEYEKLEKVF